MADKRTIGDKVGNKKVTHFYPVNECKSTLKPQIRQH
jgi:hypothetical protein